MSNRVALSEEMKNALRAATEKSNRIGVNPGSGTHIPQAYRKTHFDNAFSLVGGINTHEFDSYVNRPKVDDVADYHPMARAQVKVNYAACDGGVKPSVYRALISQLVSAIQTGNELIVGFALVILYASFTKTPKSATDLLVSKDIQIELAPLSSESMVADAHTDAETKRLDEEFAANPQADVSPVVLGFILMIMGKKPAPLQTNWEEYVERRVSSILGAVGISISPSYVISILPNHTDMIKFHTFIASMHKLRAALTEWIIGQSQGRGVLREVFNVVDKNLVWSEMTHVKMIWTYILNHFTELSNLDIGPSMMEIARWAIWWSSLRCTVLGLHTPSCFCTRASVNLSAEALGKLSTAAYCVARFYSPTLNNCKGTVDSAYAKLVTAEIETYLICRTTDGANSLTYSANSGTSPAEVEFAMLSDLDGSKKAEKDDVTSHVRA